MGSQTMADEMIQLSVIIVNWNTRDLLLGCLRSIAEHCQDTPHQVIVVDNASADGSAEAVRLKHPGVELIASDKNLGFAAGNNLGLEHAQGEFVLFLNPDTVVKAGSISQLMAFLREHEEVGIVGPKLVGRDGSPQISSFGLFPSPLEAAAHALRVWRVAPRSKLATRFHIVPSGQDTWVETEHVLGACMLVRKGLLDQLGGFDEGYFLFLEETDLCYRARERGWQIAYVTDAEVVHFGEQSMQPVLDRAGGMYIRSYNRFCRHRGVGLTGTAAANAFLVVGVVIESILALWRSRSLRRTLLHIRSLYYAYAADPRAFPESVRRPTP